MLRTYSQVAVCEVLNDFRTSTGDDGVITIDLGDIYAAETRSVVLRLSLRPVQATGSVLLGDLDVSWARSTNRSHCIHSLPVEIQAGMPGDIDLEENDRVREQVLISKQPVMNELAETLQKLEISTKQHSICDPLRAISPKHQCRPAT